MNAYLLTQQGTRAGQRVCTISYLISPLGTAQLGGIDDLNEAIVLERGALALRPPNHPGRPSSLNNLAVYLTTRDNLLGGIDDLNDPIVLSRDALVLFPPGHPYRSTCLNNLAAA